MVADVGLTYEQLRSIIDSLLIESGYYQCQQSTAVIWVVSLWILAMYCRPMFTRLTVN